MQLTSETEADGVMERLFELEVRGERVPGVIWSAAGVLGARPLLLCGHGGSLHKKFVGIVNQARKFVTKHGFAVAAIDAPGHGGRPTSEHTTRFLAEVKQRVAEGKSFGEEAARESALQAVQAVPEWQATLDALQALDFVGTSSPVGYCGVSLGAAIGVPLVAAEPRIKAAVFGVVGLLPGAEHATLAAAAARIVVPVQLAIQWDDEIVPRSAGLALFDALGSREKTLHANPGPHAGMPVFERESWEPFFARHLRVQLTP